MILIKDNMKFAKSKVLTPHKNKIMQRIALFLVFVSLFTSCRKDDNSDTRSAGVNEYLDLNLPSFLALSVPNNYIYYPSGTRGIIIFRKSTTEFLAFERACPYDAQLATGLVSVETTLTSLKDSTCGSRFSLFDGGVINGPATRPLSQYRTELLQGNILHIFN
jgi:nitrite reductase/ring-hydroxylating ferredoxin subunit